MILCFAFFCWAETYNVQPQDSFICEIYDSEVEIISDTIDYIEISSEESKKDIVKIEQDKTVKTLIIGEINKPVHLLDFRGSFDNTDVIIKHKVKIKIPKNIKLVVKGYKSRCYFNKFVGSVIFSVLQRTNVYFDNCTTDIKVLKTISSNIEVVRNQGHVTLDTLISTPIILNENNGKILLVKGITQMTIEDCLGDVLIHFLEGVINIKSLQGTLLMKNIVGRVFIFDGNREMNFEGVIKNVNIKMQRI